MFVFRNFTIENLFPEGTLFSGYGDISYIPTDEKELVWFYQAPISLDDSSKAEEVDSFRERLDLITGSLASGQTLYVCSLLDLFPFPIVEFNKTKTAIWRFNVYTEKLALSSPNVKLIDISEYFANYPVKDWINWRFYFISQMIVAPSVAAGFKDWFELRKAQADGKRKKCLVLDLDNTLWGGVLGEEGIDGIKVNGDYPGNAFLSFQEALIALSKTGVILTVCSKNNEEDVKELWQKNPFVKLNSDYISAYRINWNNKADNIMELATELNIGLDSMVFIDDNPTERELVRQRLPMVAVPDFPKKPHGLMNFFADFVNRYFLTPSLTSEDLSKTEQYKANAQRAEEARKFTDLSDFIKSLEININLVEADSFNIPRIAQMTQKTNQFNLTTKRYSEADIIGFIDSGSKVFCASVSDKFGDSGITAAIIVNIDGDKAYIDSYLLSCRILGKGIENAILKNVLNKLLENGIRKVEALYIPTKKNAQVADFYDKNGFSLVEENSDGSKLYKTNLVSPIQIEDYYNFND